MMAIIFAFSAFAACGTSEKPDGDTTAEETPLEEPDYTFKEYNVKDNIDNLKLLGRSLLYGDSILMDWSASGISFNFHGAETLRLKMTFQSEVNNGKADIVVTIDNKDYTVSASGKGARKYTVTTSLEDGDHSVTIRRKSMVESGAKGLMLSLESVSFAGYFLEKPADNTYKVAFVGDSITCGVGLDGKNEDGLATYAVNFVDNNNYDYDICAISGIGVQYSTEKHGYGDHNMAEYYPYYNYYRSDAIMYVPERKADFVVVNLNTNDNKGATEKLYKEAVKKLISEIRAVNGAKTPPIILDIV